MNIEQGIGDEGKGMFNFKEETWYLYRTLSFWKLTLNAGCVMKNTSTIPCSACILPLPS